MAIFKVTHKPSGRTAVVRACCLDCARETIARAEGSAWLDVAAVDVELVRSEERKSIVIMVAGPDLEPSPEPIATAEEPQIDD